MYKKVPELRRLKSGRQITRTSLSSNNLAFPGFQPPQLGAPDGTHLERAHPARRSRRLPSFRSASARRMRALLTGAPSQPPRSGAERGSKPNCLSTGTCELFGGPLSASTAGDFLAQGCAKKRLCWGALSLWLLSLCASKEKVTRAKRGSFLPRAAEKVSPSRRSQHEPDPTID